jgi:hypothetical protein
MKWLFSPRNQFGNSVAVLCCATDGCREELGVTNNPISGVDKNQLFDTGAREGIQSSIYAPTVLAAEVYGGGSEHFPSWRLPLWPFSWIRMFAQEEE